MAHDNDIVRHFGDDAEIVRDEQNTHSKVRLQRIEKIEDLRLNRDIECSRRFVAISSFGEQANAMAIMTRCAMPPENWCT